MSLAGEVAAPAAPPAAVQPCLFAPAVMDAAPRGVDMETQADAFPYCARIRRAFGAMGVARFKVRVKREVPAAEARVWFGGQVFARTFVGGGGATELWGLAELASEVEALSYLVSRGRRVVRALALRGWEAK